MTLTEAFAAADGRVGFIADDGRRRATTWRELQAQARRAAGGLFRRGVRPGDLVATIGPTSSDLVTATMAIWHSGAVAVPLPLPMRLASIEAFITQTRRRIEAADCQFVLVDPVFAGYVPDMPGVTVVPIYGL